MKILQQNPALTENSGSGFFAGEETSGKEPPFTTDHTGDNTDGEQGVEPDDLHIPKLNSRYTSKPVAEFPYQAKYPHLNIDNNYEYNIETEKTIYLTFDDGPSGLTPQVLDILNSHGVKATFFVVYRDSEEAKSLYRRIVDEGHTIGLHSATHNYREIYASVDAFLDDLAVLSDHVFDITGVKPELLRFPGGSINSFSKNIYNELMNEVLRRGYTYYDWDVSSGSSTNTATTASVYSNVINGVSNKHRAIVLMHDAGTLATVSALPDIIDSLQASGYMLEVLNRYIQPTCFDYSY
jgi:peptidoglycan/xylan/chitin deacetylase (PgdA/CDA1 family)